MTEHYCPVEGCTKHEDEWDEDQPPFTSREGVSGHINAMSDEDHRRAREEGVRSTAPEGPEAGDGEGDETGDEEPEDQPETTDDQANDQPEEGGEGPSDDAMVSQEEYDRQTTGQTEGREADDDQQTTAPQGASKGGLIPSSVPPMYAVVFIAMVFAIIVFLRVRSSGSSNPEMTTDEEESSNPNEVPLMEG